MFEKKVPVLLREEWKFLEKNSLRWESWVYIVWFWKRRVIFSRVCYLCSCLFSTVSGSSWIFLTQVRHGQYMEKM